MAMNVGMIGAGKCAAVMGRYLQRHGFLLAGYASRTFASAQENAGITGSRAWQDEVALAQACDMVILSMADDAVAQSAKRLAEQGCRGKLCGMFSGALSSADLQPLRQAGNTVFSLHPPFAFSEKHLDPVALEGVVFTLEGAGEGMERLRQELAQAEIPFQEIRPEQKPRYHAAACVCANYMVSLVRLAEELLEGTDISLEMFGPMACASLAAAFERGPQNALTGPVARGDAGTLRRQLAAMPPGEAKQLYAALGRYTAHYALEDKTQRSKVEEALDT